MIDVLAAHPHGLGVNEVARQIGVNASTTSRLLATLERGGILQREPRGPYKLGLRLVALADAVLDGLDIRDLGRPVLRSLVDDTGETATLSVPGAGEAVTIDFIAGDASVVGVARLGRRSVGHATATGKVVLAYNGLAGNPLTAFTDRTITDPKELERELEQVRPRLRRGGGGTRPGPRGRGGAGVRPLGLARGDPRRAGTARALHHCAAQGAVAGAARARRHAHAVTWRTGPLIAAA